MARPARRERAERTEGIKRSASKGSNPMMAGGLCSLNTEDGLAGSRACTLEPAAVTSHDDIER